MFGYDLTYKQVIGYLILAYIALDTILFLFNGIQNTGNGGCATEDWIEGIFLLNTSKKPVQCSDNVDTGAGNTLGRWRSYALNDSEGNIIPHLYEAQVDKIVTDIKKDYVIEGFTPI